MFQTRRRLRSHKRSTRRKRGGNAPPPSENCDKLPAGRLRIQCKQKQRLSTISVAVAAPANTGKPRPTANYKRLVPSFTSGTSGLAVNLAENKEITSAAGEILTYTVHSKLGEGAQGVVYKATFPNIGYVAIKILQSFDLSAIQREMLLMARANKECGEHILKNYAVILPAGMDQNGFGDLSVYSWESGSVGIVMEYLEGADLWSVLQHGGADMTGIFRQLVETVACLHSHGIVHRDLKPENVMLVGGNIKLIDFGVGCADTVESCGASFSGTREFMAPNLFSQTMSTIDDLKKTDIYSLGMTMYVILTYPELYLPTNTFSSWLKSSYEHTVQLPAKYSTWAPILEGMLKRNPAERSSLNTVLQQINSL